MLPIKQQHRNDCLSACFASILEKQLDDVPIFCDPYSDTVSNEDFWNNVNKFLKKNKLKIQYFDYNKISEKDLLYFPKYVILGVKCFNDPIKKDYIEGFSHAVIAENKKDKLEIIFNPASAEHDIDGNAYYDYNNVTMCMVVEKKKSLKDYLTETIERTTNDFNKFGWN